MGIRGSAAVVDQSDFKDVAEPAARLNGSRPGDSETAYDDGTKSAVNHAGTQSYQERRNIHQSYQKTIDKAMAMPNAMVTIMPAHTGNPWWVIR